MLPGRYWTLSRACRGYPAVKLPVLTVTDRRRSATKSTNRAARCARTCRTRARRIGHARPSPSLAYISFFFFFRVFFSNPPRILVSGRPSIPRCLLPLWFDCVQTITRNTFKTFRTNRLVLNVFNNYTFPFFFDIPYLESWPPESQFKAHRVRAVLQLLLDSVPGTPPPPRGLTNFHAYFTNKYEIGKRASNAICRTV